MTGAPLGRRIVAVCLSGATLLLASCSAAAAPATSGPTPSGSASAVGTGSTALPPTTGRFDYQLGGTDDGLARSAFDVVVRDAGAAPLSGAYSICYVNGFQTQPGEEDGWLAREDLLLHDAGGDPVVDPAWPDEYVLDPSTKAQRDGILDIVGPVISGCAEKGFHAVEIDNLDTWTRFDAVSEAGARSLAAAYVARAHELGMAIAQKNASESARVAHEEIGFDFAISEECGAQGECAAYTEVYGSHVLQVEYPDALDDAGLTFADVCAQPDRAPLTILRDRDLTDSTDPDHLYEAC